MDKERKVSAQLYIKQYLSGFRIEELIEGFEDLSERQRDIVIRVFLKMENPAIIGEDWKISYERVRQIGEKTRRRIGSRIASVARLHKELEEKDQKLRLLEWKIQKLSKQLEEKHIKELPVLEIDGIDIEDLDMSVRLYNTLKAWKINNIGQIKELSRKDFFGMRNVGKRAFEELVEIMEDKGINWPED
jgi:hypothetical protein